MERKKNTFVLDSAASSGEKREHALISPSHTGPGCRASPSYGAAGPRESLHASASGIIWMAPCWCNHLPTACHPASDSQPQRHSFPGEWRIRSRVCRADNCGALAGEGGSTRYEVSCENHTAVVASRWRFLLLMEYSGRADTVAHAQDTHLPPAGRQGRCSSSWSIRG